MTVQLRYKQLTTKDLLIESLELLVKDLKEKNLVNPNNDWDEILGSKNGGYIEGIIKR